MSWIVLIPIWQYPDEQSHFAQVQDVAEFGSVIPKGANTSAEIVFSENILDTQRDGFGNNKFTYHPEHKIAYSNGKLGPHEEEIINLPQEARTKMLSYEATRNPPVYYFLASKAYKMFYKGSLFTRVFTIRVLSISLFLLNVVLAYKIAKLLFEKNQHLSIGLTAFIAFFPMLVFASTGVLPDTLTNALFSLIVFLSLKLISNGPNPFNVMAALITVLLGFLTRQQFILAIPIYFFAITIYLIRTKSYRKLLATISIIPAVLLFFKLFPHFLHLPEIGLPNLSLLVSTRFLINLTWTMRHTYYEILPWYWGVYKWLSLTLPHPVYQIINRLIILSLFGLVIRFVKIIKSKKILLLDTILIFFIGVSMIYFLIFAIGDFYFQNQYGYSFGVQGRYFFPLVIIHMTILLIGFWQLYETFLTRYAKYVLLLTIFLMIVFNDVSLSFVSASYYNTSELKVFVNQASQYKPLVLKGNIILLILLASLFSQALFIFSYIRNIIRSS